MRLSLLTKDIETLFLSADATITGITLDSREVQAGFLFIATPGTQSDGRTFIPEAIQRGAGAVLTTEQLLDIPPSVACLLSSNIRHDTAIIASRFYRRKPQNIAAITGTSGKTSTAQFVREIWQTLGHTSASIGTLGVVTQSGTDYGSLTTPDAVTLHRLLDDLSGKGITHLSLEASSHGLDLHRLDNVHVKVAGFTNLSRDHMDYHGTPENYLNAKLRLFRDILPPDGTVVLNADIPEIESLITAAHGKHILTYGHKGADIRLLKATPESDGQRIEAQIMGHVYDFRLPAIGEFQSMNILCALGLVIANGAAADKAVAAAEKISGVPGRLQLVGTTPSGATIFVDYAHKPDALENVLKAMRPHVTAHEGAKLGVAFGCGGNRDSGKRPIMGEIATRLADWTIITDDNPRREDAATIRREVLAGCANGVDVLEIGDRAEAIKTGIMRLGTYDVFIIAGKGHESGQIVGEETHPFDDAEVARVVLGAIDSPNWYCFKTPPIPD
jgi:UDP-N-acetylmuramoyl-L-alanyl-D-glutamate--2,6-diaminopimelate ligase